MKQVIDQNEQDRLTTCLKAFGTGPLFMRVGSGAKSFGAKGVKADRHLSVNPFCEHFGSILWN